jgi:hypothetical protein
MIFNLKKYHRNTTDDELLKDLRRVAEILNKKTVRLLEYRKFGNYSDNTLCTRFGPWSKVLKKAGLELTGYHINISDEELFENIELLWIKLGRQPSRRDMIPPLSKYSERPYIRRFGGWTKSLEAFVEYANADNEIIQVVDNSPIKTHITNRDPNLRLRFKVMLRDSFKCQHCGKSPATHQNCILHVDHIIPWVSGGETIKDNLQTLCQDCNLGKGCLSELKNINE